ncbi:Hca operon transcriptional activator HcaR [Streptomyces sp. RB5]|uniref:Hca operon transcriptional activator HcaR n=1 Tax=Streptomyces smaragdinus TaxID=2585196 RepID=A0A7K0CGD1_9ACTN|nr:LysR family transcriptional regulator [Streptomyces smaragdinus]MQY12531.1 Hca operon transcriptional activator HcaR [Streptomyces smaragdinus]
MELELRHLKLVHAIAEAGSLTRAATSMGLAQSAISAQLKRIERTLGGPLFARDRAGARPTALGELVLDRSRVLLPAVRELQDEAVRFANALSDVPRFRVGGTHGPLMGALLDRLAAIHPDEPVTTYTSWSVQTLCEMTSSGRLDFALIGVCGESPPPSEQLQWREVGTDPVFAMLPDGHPLAHATEVRLEQLRDARWTTVPGEGCFADCFSSACARAGFTPSTMLETDTASCVHLVQVGRAVGLCRATMPPTPGLVTVPIAGTPLSWRHLIGWHPDSPAAGTAPGVVMHARASHGEAVRRNARYAQWLATHPQYGTITS